MTTPGDLERRKVLKANGVAALRRLKGNQTYEDWRTVGEAMLVITEETLDDLGLDQWDENNRKLTREFTHRFENWEMEAGSNYKPLAKQERWALRELMTNPVYHAWYQDPANLTAPERRRLNHPNAIINRYKAKHPDLSKKKTRKVAPPEPAVKAGDELAAALARTSCPDHIGERSNILEPRITWRSRRASALKGPPLTSLSRLTVARKRRGVAPGRVPFRRRSAVDCVAECGRAAIPARSGYE